MVSRLKTRAAKAQKDAAVHRIRYAFYLILAMAMASFYKESAFVFQTENYQAYLAVLSRDLFFPNGTRNETTIAPNMISFEARNITASTTINQSTIQQELSEEEPPIPHPHAGARFSNGTWGYVADVTAVRRRMLSLYFGENTTWAEDTMDKSLQSIPQSYLPLRRKDLQGEVCGVGSGEGQEGKEGWKLLTEKVQVQNNSVLFDRMHQTNSSLPPKILCGVYTTASKTPNIVAIGETYGWRCDGFFAASTKTEEGIGAIDLPHNGKEEYKNMWQKTRSILAYMYDNYLTDFDFFYLAGDDTHLIVENLKVLLQSMGKKASDFPLYLGQWIYHPKSGQYYVGGGSGYVLNRLSLQLLVDRNCKPNMFVSHEDRAVGKCLHSSSVIANSSVDNTGAQTFHGMNPSFVATFKGKGSKFFRMQYTFWGKHWGWKTGFNLTSTNSVAFHLFKTPDTMRRHHAILYQSCPLGTVVNAELLLSHLQ